MNRRATRVAVVTGAGAGIGKAIAERLAQGGVEVVGVDLAFDEEPTEGIRHEQIDVTDIAAMRQLIDDIAQQRRLDILVNNAAVIIARTVVDCAEDDYDRVMAVNVKAPFFTMQAAIPHMLEGRGGSIVNIGSISSVVGLPEQSVYCASKGALAQLTRQVAVDFAAHGIRCNMICPGTIQTPLLSSFLEMASDGPATERALLEKHPIARFGSPEEVAGVVEFLVSDAASFIHGALLNVDGGYVAW